MNIVWISLLSIIIIVLIVLLVLAYYQNQKVKSFRKAKSLLSEELSTLKEVKLIPQAIEYDLPDGESCYYKNIIEFNSSKHYYNLDEDKILNEADSNLAIRFTAGILNIKVNSYADLMKSTIYITNKRIVFIYNNNYRTLWLKNINNIYATLYNTKNGYEKGFLIYCNDRLYQIFSNDLKLGFILKKVIIEYRKASDK